ncbi:MAG: GTPase ObgE [Pedosphaera sp.]|nr:GTPase ObgE [Pedosphaera sp.]MSU43317.1 GTPase ObgE [Pedosphaera sp.]
MFVDQVKIFARAGRGGRGCVAFRREIFVPKGGPDGGNGGRGGDVILEASHDINNLIAQFFNPRLLAQSGEHGLGKGMDGHAGKDIIVKVPCGTIVWQVQAAQAPEEKPVAGHVVQGPDGAQALAVDWDAPVESTASKLATGHDGEFVTDLTEHGQRFVLCGGGRGGLGNRNFATARRQTPRFAQPGEEGAEGHFLFELRLIADAGLVGFPNAGKSTLLTAISKARPKIAAYPFTTLHPQIGVLEYADWRRLVVCDIPGLIEGAHMNVGLGHEFLRHIRRCAVLVLMLDMAGTDAREPWADYRQILSELKHYDPVLLDKPRLVVANKMDEPAAAANLKKFKQKVRRVPVLEMAAAFDVGLPEFKQHLRTAVIAAGGASDAK